MVGGPWGRGRSREGVGDLRRRGAPLNNGYAQIAERRIPAVSRVSLESIAFETGSRDLWRLQKSCNGAVAWQHACGREG
jgi:hypothetical protein